MFANLFLALLFKAALCQRSSGILLHTLSLFCRLKFSFGRNILQVTRRNAAC